MPCTYFKCNPFLVGQTLTVYGKANPDAKFFHVAIGDSVENVVMLIDPRFGDNQVVFNTMTDGTWGENKVHQGGFPFQQGKEFAITILFTHQEFLVTLPDGSKFQYPNKFHRDEYPHLTLNGDAQFQNIEMV